jgi:hypothetical protein
MRKWIVNSHPHRKQSQINYEPQFTINSMLNNKIKKKDRKKTWINSG